MKAPRRSAIAFRSQIVASKIDDFLPFRDHFSDDRRLVPRYKSRNNSVNVKKNSRDSDEEIIKS